MARRPTSKDAESSGEDSEATHTEERTVRHRAFRYTNEVGGTEFANKGDVIYITVEEAERGDELGAFEETYEGDPTMQDFNEMAEALQPGDAKGNVMPPTAADTTVPGRDDVTAMSDEDLRAFVNDSSVADITDSVATAESAERVRSMEESQRGSDARKTLLQNMAAIIAQEGAAADNNDDEEPEDLTTEE
jgi:hypothetical protein